MFKLGKSLTVLALGASQSRAQSVSTKHHQVAIIGAGAAGSSAAYHLEKFAAEAELPVNITVFEKTDHIGGRTTTVNAYDDPSLPIELGASIFIKLNHIIYNAALEFNLTLREAGSDQDEVLGIWDGDSFVYQQDDGQWSWWNLAKLFWKYGLAPYRAQKLMQSTVAQFLQLYEKPHFPFRSLTTTAFELNLTYVTGLTGDQYLAQNNLNGLFAHDLIQAATRVNYASNLGKIHGLETMVAIAPEGASQVIGGNWRIFAGMLEAIGAVVQLNSSVSYIGLDSSQGSAESQAKYIIKTKSSDTTAAEETETTEPLLFDKVIIANPYQFSNIKVGDDVFQRAVEEIPYVELHVTLFASPLRLSPGFFKLPPGTLVPTTVLTTLGEGEDSSSGVSGAGKAGFFSISTLRTVTNPKTGNLEYLYKIFAPEKATPKFLSSLLGAEVPETFTRPGGDWQDPSTDTMDPVSWIYPHVFYSYPKAYPRVTFQDPVIGNGLYYTSGMESFISTMETSALMGKNVARLLLDDLLDDLAGVKGAGKVNESQSTLQPQDDGGQAVLGG